MTLLLSACLRARESTGTARADCVSRVSAMAGVRWLHEYVPRRARLDGFMLAGVDANAEAVARQVVNELRRSWLVHAGLFRHRIGGIPGKDFLRGDGSVSVFACNVAASAEDEWNEYYDSVHFPNVVRQPIYFGGARFVRVGAGSSDFGGPVRKYLVVYELRPGVGLESLDPSNRTPEALAEYEDWLERGQPLIDSPVSFAATK